MPKKKMKTRAETKRAPELKTQERQTRQLNIPTPPDLHQLLKAVAVVNGLKLTTLATDAFRWFLGDRSVEIERRREICVETAKKLQGRSFDFAPEQMQAAI